MDTSATSTHSEGQAVNLFQCFGCLFHFIYPQGMKQLDHFFHSLAFYPKCDTRHATHYEIDALFDYGTHDLTTCITLFSTLLAQQPIDGPTGDFRPSNHMLESSILEAPMPIRVKAASKATSPSSLLSTSRCDRGRPEQADQATHTHKPFHNSLLIMSSILSCFPLQF